MKEEHFKQSKQKMAYNWCVYNQVLKKVRNLTKVIKLIKKLKYTWPVLLWCPSSYHISPDNSYLRRPYIGSIYA